MSSYQSIGPDSKPQQDAEGNIQGLDYDPESHESKRLVGDGKSGRWEWLNTWFVRESVCEFVATGLFVFIGAGAEFNTAVLTNIALAHAAAITFLVSATAATSGGHLNPAVSLAALIMGRIGLRQMLMYWAAQLSGAVIGGLVLMAATNPMIWGRLGAQTLSADTTPGQGILWEVLLTFVLVFVVAGAAMRPVKSMGKLAPLTVGLTVLGCILAGSERSGAAMNPARCFGPSLARSFVPPLPPTLWTYNYVYWVGPFIGASVAGVIGRFMFP